MKTLSKEDWTLTTKSLFDEVSQWTRHQKGWDVSPETTYAETVGGKEAPTRTETPALMIQTPKGNVRLEPIGRKADGTGIVKMSAWPTLVRVRLLYSPEKRAWEMVTDAGIPFHHEWNEQNFVRLTQDLIAAL